MDKRKEIPAKSPDKPGEKPPNAAPKADVDRVRSRIAELGIEFHECVKRAGLGYATGYRFLNYTASVGSLRKLEEWVVKEERRQKRPAQPTGDEQDERLAAWTEMGRELQQIDPDHFESVIDGLREVLEAEKLRASGFRKILRANPDVQR
ncbi:MAG: hypothetical protein AB7O24_04370 [Kofleriaceae bacterium]